MSVEHGNAQFSVVKRSGRLEPYIPDKALATLRKFCYGINADALDLRRVVHTVSLGMVTGLSTADVQHELSIAAANMATYHPDYSLLAGRLEIAQLHRSTQKQFSDYVLWLAQVDPTVFSDEFVEVVGHHGFAFDHALRHARDYNLRYLSVKSLETTYLLRYNGTTVERPQWLYMRVAVALHGRDVARVLETYDLLSRGFYTHATPTLVNAGRRRQSLSSCFIISANCSTSTTTYEGLRDIANIFMADGGVGLDLHTVPAQRTDRPQAGVIPYLRVVDATVRLTSQHKASRPSALTATIPIWHSDVLDFIDLKNNRGQEHMRARDIFTAVLIPDLFMRRVKEDGQWYLLDPRDVPELLETYGDEFEAVYTELERTQRPLTVVRARVIWDRIIAAQIETGGPFILYLEAINNKSNHKHRGVVQSANLCTEIVQYAAPGAPAVCTLSSLILPAFVTPERDFDFAHLHRVTQTVVRNTDRVLDINDYPSPQAKHSAETTRAIGVGVQGLADVFMRMQIPYDSDTATTLNRDIFETIYHAALDASCELARQYGPYATWEGSPASHLQLQFDLWGVEPSARYDWSELRTRIHTYGLRNSMLTAQMPTSSTSQVAVVTDSTEPCVSNVYTRRTLSGEFQILNGWLIRDLIAHRMWGDGMREEILRANGSIQHIPDIPSNLKAVYKTAWEIPQKRVLDMAIARGPYICQSQSMSVYMAEPTPSKLNSMHFYAWQNGLKTGMYYLRSQPPVFPDRFGLMPLSRPPAPPIILDDDSTQEDAADQVLPSSSNGNPDRGASTSGTALPHADQLTELPGEPNLICLGCSA